MSDWRDPQNLGNSGWRWGSNDEENSQSNEQFLRYYGNSEDNKSTKKKLRIRKHRTSIVIIILFTIVGLLFVRIITNPNRPASEVLFYSSNSGSGKIGSNTFDSTVYPATSIVEDENLSFQVVLYTYISSASSSTERVYGRSGINPHHRSVWSYKPQSVQRSGSGGWVKIPAGFSVFGDNSDELHFRLWGVYRSKRDEPIQIEETVLQVTNGAGYVLFPQWDNAFSGVVAINSPLAVRQEFQMRGKSEFVTLHLPWTDKFKIVKFDMP